MRTIINKTQKAFEDISMVFLLVLFASVFIQIVMRNFFSSGSVVLEELARFCLVSLVFLMVPVLVVDRQHIIVDILLVRLAPKVRRIFSICIEASSIALAIFLLFAIKQVMDRNWSVRTPAMRIGLLFMVAGSALHMVDSIGNKDGEAAE
jgi:TRAP-type C4-dicarboxylate transport system permease small subunit